MIKSLRRGKALNREIIEYLVLFFILGPGTLYFTCTGCYTGLEIAVASSIFSGYFWVALWKGNAYGACALDLKISWIDRPLTRLMVGIILTFLYTVVVVAVGYYGFFTLYLGRDFYETLLGNPERSLLWPVVVTFLISTFMHGRSFFLSWRAEAVNVEKLKSEQLSSRFESLKNQVNPHFLFNSLNALTSLVHKDADLSEKFIKKLSDVYRYVLDSQDKEVVDMADELNFTESFIFLQKIRHGNSLHVTIEIPEDVKKKKVPPLAFQMLIENAIKHNVVSEAKPLNIVVSVTDGRLIVSNNLQRRKDVEKTSGLGMNNIKMRYEFLSNQSIQIDETGDQFTVKIPILSFDK